MGSHLDCATARETISADHDDEAGACTRSEVADHLDLCAPCARFADAITALSRRTRVGAAHAVPDLSETIARQVVIGRAGAAPRQPDEVDGREVSVGEVDGREVSVGEVDGHEVSVAGAGAGPARPRAADRSAGGAGAASPGSPASRRRDRSAEVRALVALAGLAQLVIALPMLLGLVGPDLHLGRDLGALQVALGVGLLFAAAQPRRAHGLLPVAVVVASVTVVAAAIDVMTGVASLAAESTHLAELVGVVVLWALSRQVPVETAPTLRPVRAEGL
jgi:predicted anti-sigma-YlaC factor YlaD